MAAAPSEAPTDERISSLLARGWQPIDSLPCNGLKAGSFYELIGEESSQDFFVLNQGTALASKSPWPEPPLACHPIPSPNFVEEL